MDDLVIKDMPRREYGEPSDHIVVKVGDRRDPDQEVCEQAAEQAAERDRRLVVG
jgi:hypothetical protein